MKVDLEKITLGHSSLTDNIYAGTIIKPGIWRNKTDVTNAFIDCVIARWENQSETIALGEESWVITVRKKNRPIVAAKPKTNKK